MTGRQVIQHQVDSVASVSPTSASTTGPVMREDIKMSSIRTKQENCIYQMKAGISGKQK